MQQEVPPAQIAHPVLDSELQPGDAAVWHHCRSHHSPHCHPPGYWLCSPGWPPSAIWIVWQHCAWLCLLYFGYNKVSSPWNIYYLFNNYLQAEYSWSNCSELPDVLQLCWWCPLQSCHSCLLGRADWNLGWSFQSWFSYPIHFRACYVSFHLCCLHHGKGS